MSKCFLEVNQGEQFTAPWSELELQRKLEFLVRRVASRCKATAQRDQKTVPEFVTALKRCSKLRDLDTGKRIHREAVSVNLHTNKYVTAVLITMYSKCRDMVLARQVFDQMIHRDVVTWTSLILGYVENGESFLALELFSYMDCEPDSFTYVAAIKACAVLASERESGAQTWLEKGIIFHREVQDHGYDSDIVVSTSLVDMYSKCRNMHSAKEVFDQMLRKNGFTWNSLITGYVENGEPAKALEVFDTMDCQPDAYTYAGVLKACASLASEDSDKEFCIRRGTAIHAQLKENGFGSDIVVTTSLLDMYRRCGCMQSAREVFDGMKRRDVVTWTSLIMGYVENSRSAEAISLFATMDCKPNTFTYVAALKACGNVAALAVGQDIHRRVTKAGLERERVVVNSLMDFYVKSGRVRVVEELFNTLHFPDAVSWNTLIAGHSSVGDSPRVFCLARRMHQAGAQMNGITFTCILTACSHAGLVEESKRYFERMLGDGIISAVEHYNCLVDVLGRANRLREALALINGMPVEADIVTWRTLLGACKKWKNLEVGRVAFDALAALDTKTSAAYVLMGDIYGRGELDTSDSQGNVEQSGRKPGRTWWCDCEGRTFQF